MQARAQGIQYQHRNEKELLLLTMLDKYYTRMYKFCCDPWHTACYGFHSALSFSLHHSSLLGVTTTLKEERGGVN